MIFDTIKKWFKERNEKSRTRNHPHFRGIDSYPAPYIMNGKLVEEKSLRKDKNDSKGT
jgi:hypothetical protein